MNATLSASALAAALSKASHVIVRRSTIPILSNVRIAATGNVVMLAATDLNASVVATVPSAVEVGGETTVCGERLAAFLAGLPKEAEANLQFDGAVLKATCGRRSAKLPTLPAGDFPPVEDFTPVAEWSLDYDAMDRLAAVNVASSTEETRYYLKGVHLSTRGGQLTATATDGHRLLRVTIPAGDTAAEVPARDSTIIPSGAVLALAKLFPDGCAFSLGVGRMRAAQDGLVYTSKLIDGTYPDADRVIPVPSENLSIEAAAPELARVALSVAKISGETAVRLEIDGGRLIVRSVGLVAAEDAVDATCSGAGGVGMNAKYIASVLDALAVETVRLSQNTPGSPVRIDPIGKEDRMAVVMPWRVGSY